MQVGTALPTQRQYRVGNATRFVKKFLAMYWNNMAEINFETSRLSVLDPDRNAPTQDFFGEP